MDLQKTQCIGCRRKAVIKIPQTAWEGPGGVCTPGRIGVSPPAASAFQVKQIMEEAVTRKFVHEDSSHIISFCGESVARGLEQWLLPLGAALGRRV